MVQNSTSTESHNSDAAKPTKKSFNMTGQPVLIQNSVGIYYGTLERLDTREGTALLSDGFAISPKRHITFAQLKGIQYNLKDRAEGSKSDTEFTIRKAWERTHSKNKSGNLDKLLDDSGDETGVRFVIRTRYEDLQNLAESNTVTDFAVGGIATYRVVNDSGWMLDINSDVMISSNLVSAISLTGVTIVVPVDAGQKVVNFAYLDDNRISENDRLVVDTFKSIGRNMLATPTLLGVRDSPSTNSNNTSV